MFLLSSNGEVVRGRCRSTNQCDYCARLAAVETAELLALDAMAGRAPEIWAVLTTRSIDQDPASFYDSRRQVHKALRRRWPEAEYWALVEFTTGYGKRSGGRRRPHWNLLLKGIPAADVASAREIITSVWCAREDALPSAQHVGPVSEMGGLMRYVALHFQKSSQAPPPGWRGHRSTHSRGYLTGTTPEARDAARRSLAHKRELWRAIRRGLTAHEAELAAHQALLLADATTWRLMALEPSLLIRRERDEAQAALATWAAAAAQRTEDPQHARRGGSGGSQRHPLAAATGTDSDPPGGTAGTEAARPPAARPPAGSSPLGDAVGAVARNGWNKRGS